jgi:beta-galactosidase
MKSKYILRKFFLLIIFVLPHIISFAQTLSFNKGWQFIGIQFTNKMQVIDSCRKLGTKWDDQFLIEKINKIDDTLFNAWKESLKNVLLSIKGKVWENVTLPHIAFPEPLIIVQPKEGIAYYKKSFLTSNTLRGKRLTIEFEGAMQIADVWFNGKYITQHLGGYLPFTIDITNLANYGGENTIILRLDNRASPIVPPGKPVDKLDFIYYSGLYRDVWFHITDPLHITNSCFVNQKAGGGIFVTYPQVSQKKATINVQTDIINQDNHIRSFYILQQLINKHNRIVKTISSNLIELNSGEEKHFIQEIILNNPALWSPNDPNLYKLLTEIKDGTLIVDSVITKIGIRSFFISKKTGLLINGIPVRIVGTNRHQNYPYIGNALSDNANFRDAFLIKAAGMNCVRTSHYPQAPSFLDACDKLGLLVVDCIPGWQFYNKAPAFRENVMNDIRQLIRRDRNHPSIVLWEVSLNEAFPPAKFRCQQVAVAKSEWMGKENFYTSGDSYFTKACYDVPYDDWNGNPGARNNVTYPDNAFLIREYGDYEFGGGESTSRQERKAGEVGLLQQAWNLQWGHNKNRELYPRCIGDLNWAFYDGLAGLTVGIEAWGLADIFRIPKFSYYFFQSQRSVVKNKNIPVPSGPMLYIANYWTERNSPTKVVVYSNCDEVALFLNEQFIKRQKPDHGQETDYGTALDKGGNPFNGGNANHLKHPPFTFVDIPYQKGTLKVIGFIKGIPVVKDSVCTPENAYRILLKANYDGKPLKADGADVIYIYAKIMDNQNHLVENTKNKITLKVISGNAKIVSPTTINAEAGIATFLLKAGIKKESIKIQASSNDLRPSSLELLAH